MGRGRRPQASASGGELGFYRRAETPSAQTADELADDAVSVVAGRDRQFVARVIHQGERFGRQRSLVHDKEMPLVVFYDAQHKNDNDIDEQTYGQMTGATYSLDTLLGHSPTHDLALDLGVPAWTVPSESFQALLPFLRRHLPKRPRGRLSGLAERVA